MKTNAAYTHYPNSQTERKPHFTGRSKARSHFLLILITERDTALLFG